MAGETEGIPEHDYKIMVKINFSKKGKWNRSTELCVDLKTILRSDPVMKTGKAYHAATESHRTSRADGCRG